MGRLVNPRVIAVVVAAAAVVVDSVLLRWFKITISTPRGKMLM
jgi:hypothetical protein